MENSGIKCLHFCKENTLKYGRDFLINLKVSRSSYNNLILSGSHKPYIKGHVALYNGLQHWSIDFVPGMDFTPLKI